jgi:acyl carrier protein phosphodiesterase
MNWLAHLYLSEPTPAFRLGNLLPDLISPSELAALPAEFQPGILCHRQIDAFTDTHAIFRRSIRRIEPPFLRYGGVLMDIFYDHVLAREWDSFASVPLPEFTASVYASFESGWHHIPPAARRRLEGIREFDLLCSYREIDGIAETLTRIGSRFRRPIDLAASMPILLREYKAFRADFAEFFPALIAHVGLPQPHVFSKIF